jgi:hypothetical protein
MRNPLTPYLLRASVLAALVLGIAGPAVAQGTAGSPPQMSSGSSNGKVGVSIQAGTLGIGGDVAVKLNSHANIRGGFDTFRLTHEFDDEGTIYTGKLKFQSIHAFVDWFPFEGAFHLSPGVVFGNDTNVSLSSTIAGGDSQDIGDGTYYSNPSNPIKIAGAVTAKSTGFALMMGWGNIAGGRHFTVPFEFGVIFSGAMTGSLSFTGSACNSNGTNCRDVASDPTVQADVKKQNDDLNDTLNKPFLKYYPILRLGFGIRF